jgi:hypothetical protein
VQQASKEWEAEGWTTKQGSKQACQWESEQKVETDRFQRIGIEIRLG